MIQSWSMAQVDLWSFTPHANVPLADGDSGRFFAKDAG